MENGRLPEWWKSDKPYKVCDWIDGLKSLPEKVIDCVVTSPPYWNLRDYNVDGQIGLEDTFEGYIRALCDGFDEVMRVLKDTGTVWVNLGDTYSGGGGRGSGDYVERHTQFGKTVDPDSQSLPHKTRLPDKSLVMIPFRFAIEMVNRGWILRNTIIWRKPSCMPSSVKDRFTVDYEYIFFFTKNKKYYFEQQLEPLSHSYFEDKRPKGVLTQKVNKKSKYHEQGGQYLKQDNVPGKNANQYKGFNKRWKEHKANHRAWQNDPSMLRGKDAVMRIHPEGRNKRCVWSINTKAYPDAHFATYPPELIETPIKAGCPEFVCNKCGKPREKIYKYNGGRDWHDDDIIPKGIPGEICGDGGHKRGQSSSPLNDVRTPEFQGLSDCGCNAGFSPGIVLDPFLGSGTTLYVARMNQRIGLGFELNPEYEALIRERGLVNQKGLEDFNE